MRTYVCDNKELSGKKPEKADEDSACETDTAKDGVSPVKDFVVIRLRKEIDRLADRLSEDLKRENLALRKEIAVLKSENARLYGYLRIKNGGFAGGCGI
ncbi:MAG: hypothetical protein J6Y43_07765 [Clostridia bacterium]|nr:hypothetical protein [Clostridia bacterium]